MERSNTKTKEEMVGMSRSLNHGGSIMKSTKRALCSVMLIAMGASVVTPAHALFDNMRRRLFEEARGVAGEAAREAGAEVRRGLHEAEKNFAKRMETSMGNMFTPVVAGGGILLGLLGALLLNKMANVRPGPSLAGGLSFGLLPAFLLLGRWMLSDKPEDRQERDRAQNGVRDAAGRAARAAERAAGVAGDFAKDVDDAQKKIDEAAGLARNVVNFFRGMFGGEAQQDRQAAGQ